MDLVNYFRYTVGGWYLTGKFEKLLDTDVFGNPNSRKVIMEFIFRRENLFLLNRKIQNKD